MASLNEHYSVGLRYYRTIHSKHRRRIGLSIMVERFNDLLRLLNYSSGSCQLRPTAFGSIYCLL